MQKIYFVNTHIIGLEQQLWMHHGTLSKSDTPYSSTPQRDV